MRGGAVPTERNVAPAGGGCRVRVNRCCCSVVASSAMEESSKRGVYTTAVGINEITESTQVRASRIRRKVVTPR